MRCNESKSNPTDDCEILWRICVSILLKKCIWILFYNYTNIANIFRMCGPFAVLISYLSEFHGSNFRSRIMMVIGVMFSMAAIMLPVMALTILPNDWNWDILNMNCKYFSICYWCEFSLAISWQGQEHTFAWTPWILFSVSTSILGCHIFGTCKMRHNFSTFLNSKHFFYCG